MTGKFLVYLFSTIIVIWSMDAVNINKIFKKNRIIQARLYGFIYVYKNFLKKV